MPRTPKKIALMLGWYNHQAHNAIFRYAIRSKWHLEDSMAYNGKIPDLTNCDGIIVSNPSNRQDILDRITSQACPTVEIGITSSFNVELPHVALDNIAIGRMAADYLINKGVKSLAYVFRKKLKPKGRLRAEGFQKQTIKRGKRFYKFSLNNLKNVLTPEKLPIGLFVLNDNYGYELLQNLKELGIQVPHQAAVLGVDNNPLFSELTDVSLSSIDPDIELRSFETCRLLNHLMEGGEPPDKPILIKPKGVVERASTQTMGIIHGETASAYAYLQKHYLDHQFTPLRLASKAGISRCQLDKNFKKFVGSTVSNELLRLRLDRVKELLQTTDLKVYEIVSESGFTSPEYLAYAFQKAFGCSPSKYRKEELLKQESD